MLEGVVTHGTARHTVQLAGYTAAGKTGTPQKVDPATHRYSKTKFFPNFAGFVPASQPRFVIIVAIDEPIGLHQGGTVAAPVFDRIAEAALGAYGVEPDSPDFRTALQSSISQN
jgi:cell division protein FtsI (penicillin-binding protein 3)